MPNILLFSDLHANKRALEDIIAVLEEVDLSVFCGDLLGYGKDIDFCIDFVLKNIDLVVLGDHERLAIGNEDLGSQLPVVRESTLYTKSKLSAEQKKMLSSLPTEIWYENMYITHSIGDDYLRTEKDFRRLYDKMRKETNYAFFGHTHEQVLFEYKGKKVINPGSITKGRRGFNRSYMIMSGDRIEFVNLERIL
ncbi:metallophosphatase family protein [Candidatus Bathyarchaeota archaeon]|nr:metallophosphatase family protein [Candidatus Bathyarchaeota archaeon]